MLKKTITYEDYDGTERCEDFFFNLNKAELVEWEVSAEGSLTKLIEKITQEQEVGRLVAIFKDLILRSYGEKTLDGKRFVKTAELRAGFEQTNAYPLLFMEMATDAKAALAFINGIMPSDMQVSEPDQLTLAQ